MDLCNEDLEWRKMSIENIFEKLADMLITILHNELLRDLIDKV